jgi:hypothetical protein
MPTQYFYETPPTQSICTEEKSNSLLDNLMSLACIAVAKEKVEFSDELPDDIEIPTPEIQIKDFNPFKYKEVARRHYNPVHDSPSHDFPTTPPQSPLSSSTEYYSPNMKRSTRVFFRNSKKQSQCKIICLLQLINFFIAPPSFNFKATKTRNSRFKRNLNACSEHKRKHQRCPSECPLRKKQMGSLQEEDDLDEELL